MARGHGYLSSVSRKQKGSPIPILQMFSFNSHETTLCRSQGRAWTSTGSALALTAPTHPWRRATPVRRETVWVSKNMGQKMLQRSKMWSRKKIINDQVVGLGCVGMVLLLAWSWSYLLTIIETLCSQNRNNPVMICAPTILWNYEINPNSLRPCARCSVSVFLLSIVKCAGSSSATSS